MPTPDSWSVFEALQGLPHVLFLDSALPRPVLGSYSFVCADPFLVVRSGGRRSGRRGPAACPRSDDLSRLEGYLSLWHAEKVLGLPPFQGGAAGMFGYGLCHQLERLPRPRRVDVGVPDLVVGFYDWVIGFDHSSGRVWVISTGFPETAPGARRRRAAARLRQVQRRLRRRRTRSAPRPAPLIPRPSPAFSVPGRSGLWSSFDRVGYLAAVRRAIEYIHGGDCFQVNLSQRLLARTTTAPAEVYRRLRERNPAPFAGFFDVGEFALASASPERFLRVDGGEVETRPIKGTRPRGATPAEDCARAEELRASGKDRAENIMIVDLLRNDLGRVCRYGSVRVEAVCRLESYPFVHHLVSEVRGRLREGAGPVDLIRAAFPGGSVTGAPKIRAMEIIAELEPVARGPYCGSLGYIGFDGSVDTNILIRTLTLGQGWARFPVGGGIVAESDPEREYDETWHKAEGLLRAVAG